MVMHDTDDHLVMKSLDASELVLVIRTAQSMLRNSRDRRRHDRDLCTEIDTVIALLNDARILANFVERPR